GKDAKSQDKLVHGIQVVLARNYIENLREEVKKGLREKAEQGIFPGGHPPFGYRNNTALHTIELHPERAHVAKRMFELYASGKYSLTALRSALKDQFGVKIPKSHIHRLLRNPFYIGEFIWHGKTYRGAHEPLVTRDVF